MADEINFLRQHCFPCFENNALLFLAITRLRQKLDADEFRKFVDAITSANAGSECVMLPNTARGTIQILRVPGYYPHVLYAKMFRFPDLDAKASHQLKGLATLNGEIHQAGGTQTCVNPFHYELNGVQLRDAAAQQLPGFTSAAEHQVPSFDVPPVSQNQTTASEMSATSSTAVLPSAVSASGDAQPAVLPQQPSFHSVFLFPPAVLAHANNNEGDQLASPLTMRRIVQFEEDEKLALELQRNFDELNGENNNDSMDNACIVCFNRLEGLENEEGATVVLDCGHQFHGKCVAAWQKSNTCPFCRQPIATLPTANLPTVALGNLASFFRN